MMDNAGFSEETLTEAQDIIWVMRVPENLAQSKKLVKETPVEEMVELAPGYWGKEVECEYARVQQRWLVVDSQAAQECELKTLEKAQIKELEKVGKEWLNWKGRPSTARWMPKRHWSSSTRNGSIIGQLPQQL